MITKLLLVSSILAAFTAALGYALADLWSGALLISILGLLWLVAQRCAWDWVASVALVLFVGAIAYGVWLEAQGVWLAIGLVAALSAWDLDYFRQRLSSVKCVEGQRELERRHLRRLSVVAGLGLVLAMVALEGKVTFGLAPALLLGLLVVLGLGGVIGYLRRESD